MYFQMLTKPEKRRKDILKTVNIFTYSYVILIIFLKPGLIVPPNNILGKSKISEKNHLIKIECIKR